MCEYSLGLWNYFDELVTAISLNGGIDRVTIHKELVESLNKLYAAKNKDYGNSYAKVRSKDLKSIVIRLYDKLYRIEQLLNSGSKEVPESIEDSFLDLANYCIMEVIERRVDEVAKKCATEILNNQKDLHFKKETPKTKAKNHKVGFSTSSSTEFIGVINSTGY